MNEYSFFKNPFVPLAFVLGIALVVSTGIGALTAITLKGYDSTLSVTGSAKTAVTSDSARFTFSISRTVTGTDISTGYVGIDSDLVKTKKFLSDNNVPDSEITVDPVQTYQIYDNNTNAPMRYSVSRMIKISSTRVADISTLAQKMSDLVETGIFVQANTPEYYYTKLADLRVSLLGEALKDAKARAGALAKESGQSVGKLQSASSGVVQVMAPNSIDVSDYGSYDTSSVEKEVMVTTRAVFFVR